MSVTLAIDKLFLPVILYARCHMKKIDPKYPRYDLQSSPINSFSKIYNSLAASGLQDE